MLIYTEHEYIYTGMSMGRIHAVSKRAPSSPSPLISLTVIPLSLRHINIILITYNTTSHHEGAGLFADVIYTCPL